MHHEEGELFIALRHHELHRRREIPKQGERRGAGKAADGHRMFPLPEVEQHAGVFGPRRHLCSGNSEGPGEEVLPRLIEQPQKEGDMHGGLGGLARRRRHVLLEGQGQRAVRIGALHGDHGGPRLAIPAAELGQVCSARGL